MTVTAVMVTPCMHHRRRPVQVTIEEKSAAGPWVAIATRMVDDATVLLTCNPFEDRPRRLIIQEIDG